MGVFAEGDVVSLPFPYSDLSGRKQRPALLLAFAGRQDWISCQITSNPYADPLALELTTSSFITGSLPMVSYLRPAKLFTANEQIIDATLGHVQSDVLLAVRARVAGLILGAGKDG